MFCICFPEFLLLFHFWPWWNPFHVCLAKEIWILIHHFCVFNLEVHSQNLPGDIPKPRINVEIASLGYYQVFHGQKKFLSKLLINLSTEGNLCLTTFLEGWKRSKSRNIKSCHYLRSSCQPPWEKVLKMYADYWLNWILPVTELRKGKQKFWALKALRAWFLCVFNFHEVQILASKYYNGKSIQTQGI